MGWSLIESYETTSDFDNGDEVEYRIQIDKGDKDVNGRVYVNNSLLVQVYSVPYVPSRKLRIEFDTAYGIYEDKTYEFYPSDWDEYGNDVVHSFTTGSESDVRVEVSVYEYIEEPPSTPPSITVPSESIGGEDIDIEWESSTDPDNDIDGYNLQRQIDEGNWETVYFGINTSYTDSAENGSNEIVYRVRAEDKENNISGYEESSVITIRSKPLIEDNLEDSDLGEISSNSDLLIDYEISELKGQEVTVTELRNGVELRSFVINSADLTDNEISSHTLVLSDMDWIKTPIDEEVELTISAVNTDGVEEVKSYTLIRKETKIDFELKEPLNTGEVLAERLLLNLDGELPSGVNLTVECCNNAFDNEPVWEDASSMVSQGFPYPFENGEKTSDEGGVSFRVTIERNEAEGDVYLDGIGGAYD